MTSLKSIKEGEENVENTVVVGAQFGDEGKAKITDLLASKADVVIRYQGGSNAGHTVVYNNKKYKFPWMGANRRRTRKWKKLK